MNILKFPKIKPGLRFYSQGQLINNRIREYFYFINNRGELFLQDSKYKTIATRYNDEKFLYNFFQNLRLNTSNRYKEFKHVYLCEGERNYLICQDTPIVYTDLIDVRKDDCDKDNVSNQYLNQLYQTSSDNLALIYNNCLRLTTNFDPSKINVKTEGKIYYRNKYKSNSIVKSALADILAQRFVFDCNDKLPTHIEWNNYKYSLIHT
ncbi:hypothetical protein A3Q56_03002 [Intoshia linei]|uniref:Uncharacterized protein n=1 Tax=Intoshia linei TaxID=1819745 RepID=A0A177B4R3_9BILA|nr:hypothetical protein A3Q56_03002 [Intoshia linei]